MQEQEINHINTQVFHLLEDLEAAGQTSFPRGLKTIEAHLASLEIDPHFPIMNFKPRPFNWRYFAGELAWYLKKDTSIEFINNFSSFWKNICPTGHANSNYGVLMFNPHPSSYDSSLQLEWAFNSLVNDKNTRQAVAFFNSPHFQQPGTKDFVCTMYVNFWINKDYLDMKVQMRSNDIFFGLTYDAPWFSTIHQSMFLNLKNFYPELKLGVYYHQSDNMHFYERHFEVAEKILDSNLPEPIKLTLKKPLFDFVLNEDDSTYKLELSQVAESYKGIIEDLVENNAPKEQSYWKTTLEYLYDITGDSV